MKTLKGESAAEEAREHKILKKLGYRTAKSKEVADEPMGKHRAEHRKLRNMSRKSGRS